MCCIAFASHIYVMFTYCCSLMPCYEYALMVICHLFIVCMSGLIMIDDLDIEMYLRPFKYYRWCSLMPERYHGDRLG
jgi:hypothetical protein